VHLLWIVAVIGSVPYTMYLFAECSVPLPIQTRSVYIFYRLFKHLRLKTWCQFNYFSSGYTVQVSFEKGYRHCIVTWFHSIVTKYGQIKCALKRKKLQNKKETSSICYHNMIPVKVFHQISPKHEFYSRHDAFL